MIPAARLETAIHLLDLIERERRPADDIIRAYFRPRRFAGSKDRRAIRDRVFGVLRARARLSWHGERAGTAPTPRTWVLADLVLSDGMGSGEVAALFDGSQHAPSPLDEGERTMVDALQGGALNDPAMPEPVAFEVPDWMAPKLKVGLGDAFTDEMAALNIEAPMDLRVALARVTRDQAQSALKKEGVSAEETPLSPAGLRVRAHSDIGRTRPFARGLVEVQDEGSQLLAFLVAAEPSHAVLDYCAGAGGKTLAIADRMGLQGGASAGRLVALDIDKSRMDRMDRRLERAHLEKIVSRHVLCESDPWLDENAGTFDRVLIDAPCTGSGTWRRAPVMKWRLTEDRLSELTTLQDQILDTAAKLVKPGGRLIYATCSLFAEENEDRARAFATRQADFTALPVHKVWAQALPDTPFPGDKGGETGKPGLRLGPAKAGTDGFFVTIFERKS